MPDLLKFYIDGAWVEPLSPARRTLIDPATEQPYGEVADGGAADIDRAVRAARAAFATYSVTGRARAARPAEAGHRGLQGAL